MSGFSVGKMVFSISVEDYFLQWVNGIELNRQAVTIIASALRFKRIRMSRIHAKALYKFCSFGGQIGWISRVP